MLSLVELDEMLICTHVHVHVLVHVYQECCQILKKKGTSLLEVCLCYANFQCLRALNMRSV